MGNKKERVRRMKMLSKLNKKICKIIRFVKIQKYRRSDNNFVSELYEMCKNHGGRYDVFAAIIEKYGDKLDSINENLYLKLNSADKNTLLRFFVKAFYGVSTATREEIEQIDQAFNKVRDLYKKNSNGKFIEFGFRGKSIKYFLNKEIRLDECKPENILMNYYDLTHAFYLTEYEMEDFNPNDGETILDCGAAYGDTMLLFRALYPHSIIHSFECSEENVKIINRNKELNNLENVVINHAFLYSDSEHFFSNTDNQVISKECIREHRNGISTLALDDYIQENNIENIGLIKFDIEGGEQAALRGTVETIKKQRPLLYIPIYHLDSDIYVIPEFLKQLGIPMEFKLKWTEKKVWGVDCVLFVRFLS